MTARRGPDFSLEKAVEDPGFFPRQADVAALLDLVTAGSAAAESAKRALVRFGVDAARVAIAKANDGDVKTRARLVPIIGRIAADHGGDDLTTFLLERLGDDDAVVRRASANALGKQRTPVVAAALTNALAKETDASARRAMTAALGKTGGAEAVASLDHVDVEGDELLARMTSKAALIAQRTAGRDVPSTFDASKVAPGPVSAVLHCRAGLAPILLGELASDLSPFLPPHANRLDQVTVTLRAAPERLFRARTMLFFGFPLPPEPIAPNGDVAAALTRALTSPVASQILDHFTAGPVRFRIAWADGGKHRSVTWRAAEQIAATKPSIINDPTESTWEAIVHEQNDPRQLQVELRPRVADPRFTYRQGDVPAASHPTIAAALVRVAGVRPHDIVWDPFVGSGMELCERAIAGSFVKLIGTDREPAALEIARQNLKAAGVSNAELLREDALTFEPRDRPTLVITNPPMGRRVLRGEDLHSFLDRFLAHAAQVVAPGGRIAWITPVPVQSTRVAKDLGLERLFAAPVDMGGFDAEMQLLRVPSRLRTPAPARGAEPRGRR